MSLLKTHIRESGMTQTELADSLDVEPSVVSSWVNGKYEPHPKRYDKLARLLGLPGGRRELVQIINATSKKKHGRDAA